MKDHKGLTVFTVVEGGGGRRKGKNIVKSAFFNFLLAVIVVL